MDPFIQNSAKTFNEGIQALDKKRKADEEYKEKLLESTMELEGIKTIVEQLKTSTDEFNNSSNKMAKRMLWLTIAIAALTVVYTVAAIIQLIEMS
ncbi:hypothetical protein [Aminipila sp.]|uniref:hypothetical protein n=1 Tax=Aminipila sp. TaxID=2060095 RepID=UPI002897D753|nr:hypothetical protein [Aminipila sp.]